MTVHVQCNGQDDNTHNHTEHNISTTTFKLYTVHMEVKVHSIRGAVCVIRSPNLFLRIILCLAYLSSGENRAGGAGER